MFYHIPSAASEPRTTKLTFCDLCSSHPSTLAATMVKSYSFNPHWTMSTTIFQETSTLYHILEPIIGKLFQKIIYRRSLRSSFIDSFNFAKKRCNTSQYWAPSLRNSAQYGIYFLPTSRQYNAELPSQNHN